MDQKEIDPHAPLRDHELSLSSDRGMWSVRAEIAKEVFVGGLVLAAWNGMNWTQRAEQAVEGADALIAKLNEGL